MQTLDTIAAWLTTHPLGIVLILFGCCAVVWNSVKELGRAMKGEE